MLSIYEAEKAVLNGGKYDLSVEENKINVFLASNAITRQMKCKETSHVSAI